MWEDNGKDYRYIGTCSCKGQDAEHSGNDAEWEEVKPILFLDVDGPLNPYMARDKSLKLGYVKHNPAPRDFPGGINVWLHPDHGRQLLDLPYELVWGTTWMGEANEFIGPHIGLPELPVAPISRVDGRTAPHWKLPGLVRYAAGRPFVWVDDEAWKSTWTWLQEHYGRHGEVHQVSDYKGLDSVDFYHLEKKAGTLMRTWREQQKGKR